MKPMLKAIFTIGECPKAYIGYTRGYTWNGWATPYFELSEALAVADGYNEQSEEPMLYDQTADRFVVKETDYADEETWQGFDVWTDDGLKHLYGIGAYCWIWDKVDSRDIKYLAEAIEDFLYEFDTYDYKDQYTDREETIKTIQAQLRDFSTFKTVYAIWHTEELDAEGKYNQLRKELKL